MDMHAESGADAPRSLLESYAVPESPVPGAISQRELRRALCSVLFRPVPRRSRGRAPRPHTRALCTGARVSMWRAAVHDGMRS